MSATFSWTPLFSTIIDSSVWRESKETRLVWITLLAKKNRDGFVRAALWALARDAGVTEDECREAVRVLESPDPQSHCKDNDGRRIKPVDGGWMVLNHMLYRSMISKANQRANQAAWQKEYRKRRKQGEHGAACAGAQMAIKEGFEESAVAVSGANWAVSEPIIDGPLHGPLRVVHEGMSAYMPDGKKA